MKVSAFWQLLAASWLLLLIYGGTAIAFIVIAFYGFATQKLWMAALTTIFAILSVAACWYFMKEVGRKEKELAEKKTREEKRPKYPIETVKPPIRSSDKNEALWEILRDLKKPLKLKKPDGSEIDKAGDKPEPEEKKKH